MVSVHEQKADVRLEPEDVHGTLRALATDGFQPAAFEGRERFWSLSASSDGSGESSAPPAASPSGAGDIFFSTNGDIFFLLAQGPQFTEEDGVLLSWAGSKEIALRVGLITVNAVAASDRLDQFTAKVEGAVRAAVDQKKSRQMKFYWKESDEAHPITHRLKEGSDGSSGIQFKKAALKQAEVKGSEVLANPEARRILIQLSKARIAQADDLWKGRPRGHRSRVEEALGRLEGSGLVEVNQLIRCRKANDPLMQLRNEAELQAVKDFLHPACGATYGEHELVPAYSISQLGQKLAQASHWMTIWVTKRLISLGIPERQIVWTLASGPEEIDIAVSFLDELWIFELKDREFGVGDALPFNYRQRVQYQAEQAVVITTEKVSRDARRVLDEMAEEPKRSAARQLWTLNESKAENSKPILIEGLQAVDARLQEIFEETAAQAAARRVNDLERATSFPVAAAVEARFGAVK